MDTVTIEKRIRLGLAAFELLRDTGVLGVGLRSEGVAADQATPIFARRTNEPTFMRFPLASGAGYIDLALQPWLGDPVVAAVKGVRWDPIGYEARAAEKGHSCGRWVHYAMGQAALECGEVLLDPCRGRKNELFIVPQRDTASEWGEEISGRLEANVARFDAFAVALAASAAFAQRTLSGPGPIDLPLCSSGIATSKHCVPELTAADLEWCVPAVLEMAIEYFLGENKKGEYQDPLAVSLRVGASGIGDIPAIPDAVRGTSKQKVTATFAQPDWGLVTQEIDAARPMATITSVHAFLIIGYSPLAGLVAAPPGGNLTLLNPWGPAVDYQASFAAHVGDTLLKVSSSQPKQGRAKARPMAAVSAESDTLSPRRR